MNAQTCYDDRATLEFCSGDDLSDFFYAQTGDPSPVGSTEIEADAWTFFVSNCVKAIRSNSDPAVTSEIAYRGTRGGAHSATVVGIMDALESIPATGSWIESS